MSTEKILEICQKDRNYVYKNTSSLIKKLNIDVVIKLYILIINSFGRKNYSHISFNLFIDEVKNKNMHDNMKITFEKINTNKYFLNFYKYRAKNHIKIGVIYPIFMLVNLTFSLLINLPYIFFKENTFNEKISKKCITMTCNYFNKFYNNINKIILMTDHHFYSTIIALIHSKKSYVLQHGLIMEKDRYYPIRAQHFCAWGIHTKELLNNDPKIIITGTYKFLNLKKKKQKNVSKNILFCMSSLNLKKVENKIKTLYDLSKILNFKLIIKCHPGSLFNKEYWQNLLKDSNIEIYKEEKLEDIDFDIAISENSTINLDLLMLKKPFIIFDTSKGYFGKYFDFIPNGNNKEDISKCINSIAKYDYQKIYNKLVKLELNDNMCILSQILQEVQNE